MNLTPAADTQPKPILNHLTRYQFIAGLAKVLAKSSIDSKNFKSHSFKQEQLLLQLSRAKRNKSSNRQVDGNIMPIGHILVNDKSYLASLVSYILYLWLLVAKLKIYSSAVHIVVNKWQVTGSSIVNRAKAQGPKGGLEPCSNLYRNMVAGIWRYVPQSGSSKDSHRMNHCHLVN